MATRKTRHKIVRDFLQILGDKGWDEATPAAVAAQSGVSLSVMRGEFPTRLSLLEGAMAQIDQTVLENIDEDMGEEAPRDRLFDVLMSRLDAMTPYKAAIRALKSAVARDPVLALEVNGIASVSMRWMLTAAAIEGRGWRGHIMVQGLVVAFARLLDTWLEDDDAGLARTMAKLDRELEKGGEWMARLDRAAGFVRPFAERAEKRRKRRRDAMRESHEADEMDEGEGI
ncbi:TetR/AcrR family transcriptional regulator [Rhizobiales bacterium]|uniref:TetR/AcrR family transcriptional regulator n=1 Tax=Hongsoonwoonella zoysiae TaxID=2821844 RepID=UPI00155FD415|nr:TetR/AcrR family transcriptional regulator [Hongsoonwoonella zoysiae]NRG17650.1 TetR/AcrR family transcriptional regulator [Hongsoonwoonella zoysiae]